MSTAALYGGAVETVGKFVVERYDHKGRPAVSIRQLTPKARWGSWKSYKHLLCRTPEDVDRVVGELRASLEAHEQRKASRRAERSAVDARGLLQVGAIVYNSWGYDQTNIDWYRVESVSKAFCVLRAMCASVAETGFMSGSSAPVQSCSHDHDTSRHSVRAYNGNVYVNFKHGSGLVWDGREKYSSWYA